MFDQYFSTIHKSSQFIATNTSSPLHIFLIIFQAVHKQITWFRVRYRFIQSLYSNSFSLRLHFTFKLTNLYHLQFHYTKGTLSSLSETLNGCQYSISCSISLFFTVLFQFSLTILSLSVWLRILVLEVGFLLSSFSHPKYFKTFRDFARCYFPCLV